MELSQSDIGLLDVEIEENPTPPSVVNVKPRFKSAPLMKLWISLLKPELK
jgi:hypothetical protein